MKLVVLSVLVLMAFAALPPQTPIIGVVTLPDSGDEPTLGKPYPPVLKSTNHTYIAVSYVKYLQMSGAQVVPIFAYSSTTYLDEILSKVNGVLFTGGGITFNISTHWTASADRILKYAIAQNKKGNTFPVWGTCLGFQLLVYLTSGYDSKAQSSVRGEHGVTNTLKITSQNYLFAGLSSSLINNLVSGQGSVYFNHVHALSSKYYYASTHLKSFWRATSLTTSSYNEQFVSTLESLDYPIYAVQYHPEKNLYEWKVSAVRTEYGTEIAQILSNRFVDKARKNTNRFGSDEQLRKHLIYNYKPQFTTMSFTQIYLFNETVKAEVDNRREEVNLSSE